MSNPIIVGPPLLGFEQGEYYTVCILTEPMASPPTLEVSGKAKPLSFVRKATVGSNEFWRAEFKISAAANGTPVHYEIKSKKDALTDRHGRDRWQFHVPGKKEQPQIAFASCNGFSGAKLARDTDEPYLLWRRLANQQQRRMAKEQDEPHGRRSSVRGRNLGLASLPGTPAME